MTGSYLHQDSPVHGSCIRVRYRGEEQEEVGHNEEADGDNVDRNTPSSQTELRRWKFLSLQALDQDREDDNQIAGEESSGRYRQDDVEGGRRSDDDEGE